MNGVHCQIRVICTASIGCGPRMSIEVAGADWPAKIRWIEVSTPLIRPVFGSNMPNFQNSAAAIGTIRNGAIIIVRTAPRPQNLRFSSNAMHNPRISEISTTPTVITTVFQTSRRIVLSVNTRL